MNSITIRSGKHIENLKVFCIIFIAIGLFLVLGTGVHSTEVQEDFIDLKFTIDSKIYHSKSIQKSLNIAPFIEEGVTLVPFSPILKELGYEVQWDGQESSITASRGSSKIKLKLNNIIAVVDGEDREMTVAPKVIKGTTVVPLAFVSENCGAKVVWDGSTKSIYVTRTGRFNTGKILLYEKAKSKTDVNKVYLYDGWDIKVIVLEEKEIVNWYSYKGAVLTTMFDKTKNNNNFAIFRKDEFEVLIEDFDIKDTFEYNDNLIIHGYDRSQKINMLYRFDGKELIKVADNFYVGKRFIFKDKLVINKYNNSRNYSLVAFDKSSWTPGLLKDGFIIQDSVETDNAVYMTGVWQVGTKKPFASYDGNFISESSFKVLHPDITVDLKKIAVHRGKIYLIIGSEIKTIENSTLVNVLFPFANVYLKYNATAIKQFNNEIYIGMTGAQFVDYFSRPARAPSGSVIFPGVIKFSSSVSNWYNVRINFQLAEFRVENDRLIMLGINKTENDPALYITDGTNVASTLDVLNIKNTLSLGDKIFIDVSDKDRITGTNRNTMLLYSNNTIKNLILGMDMKKWSKVGAGLIFAGYESDIKKNKLYSYNNEFNELLNNFEVKYWNLIGDKLFINGINPDESKLSLYKVMDLKKESLRDNIEVIKIINARGEFYLVYAVERDNTSPLKGKKIVYIYDDRYKRFIEMKVDIEITDMIFMK
ncbi:MAG: copper amine oxidase N-terminal domain-containing protein [Clostridia bacterium]|nr:copper amine oxidase N-terminal domain-containing protein [Clostridia bacterium]